jgi:DeoR/GlpR family transcriptional regulator of sugar metabolism
LKERTKEILRVIQKEKEVTVSRLSERFGVSEVTIRKDLFELEHQGLILRTHGGAMAITEKNAPHYFARIRIETEEKEKIAKAAAELIRDGDSVLVDAGSTALAVARLLKPKHISIVTNSIPVCAELHDFNGTLSMTSGEMLKGTLALTGPDTEAYLDKVQVDKLILGASGFRPDLGFTTSSAILAAVKKKMIRASQTVILVVDHTKFTSNKLAHFADFRDIDIVVTSRLIPEEALNVLREHNVQVVLTP